MLTDGLVVLLTAAHVEWGGILNQALYRAVGDGVIQNRAFDDGTIQGLDVFPTEDGGIGCPVAGIDDELAVFRTSLIGAPVQPAVFDGWRWGFNLARRIVSIGFIRQADTDQVFGNGKHDASGSIEPGVLFVLAHHRKLHAVDDLQFVQSQP